MADHETDYAPSDESGVITEFDPETKEIIIRVPTYLLHAPRKPYAGRELEAGSGVYECPRYETFVYVKKALRSRHTIALTVQRPVEEVRRRELFEKLLKQGINVIDPANKVRQRKYAVEGTAPHATTTAESAESQKNPRASARIKL